MKTSFTFPLLITCYALSITLAMASPSDAPAPEASSGLHSAQSITTQRGVCVTAHPLATKACQTMLNQGGTAADGAMAAAWMLGLVEPQSS